MARVQIEAILRLTDVQINPRVFQQISRSVAGLPRPMIAFNQTVNQTVRTVNNLRSSMNFRAGNTSIRNVTNNIQNLGRTANNVANQMNAASSASRSFLQRMAQFAVLLPTFVTLNNAIQGSVKFLFEFDSILRDIVRTDPSQLADRMKEIGDVALDSAVKFGKTGIEVLQTTKLFVQAGKSVEEAQQLTNLALKASAASTLDVVQSTEFLIATQEQFGLSGKALQDAIDGLIKVEDAAAVEAADLAEAFRTGGNSLAVFGKDINDAIGIVSALREQTRKSGREIGTFLKTLQTRIFAAGEARDAVEALGVQVVDIAGNTRPVLAVLNDLKKAFSGLSEEQQASAAKAIGGVRQFESLIATLNSLDRANQLSAESANASGTANAKFEISAQKLQFQLDQLIATGQQFAKSLGDAGLEDTLRGVLKITTSLLEIFTKIVSAVGDIGGLITPLLALGGVRLLQGAGLFNPNAISGFGQPVQGPPVPPNMRQSLGGRVRQSVGSFVNDADYRREFLNSSRGLALVAGASIAVSAGFNVLESQVDKLGKGPIAETSKNLLDVGGTASSAALAFAPLGLQAMGLAGALTALGVSIYNVIEAYQENQKANTELKDTLRDEQKERIISQKVITESGKDFGQEIINAFAGSLQGTNLGADLSKGMDAALAQIAKSGQFKDMMVDGEKVSVTSEDLRNAIVGNPEVIKQLVKENLGTLEAIADKSGKKAQDAFSTLKQSIESGDIDALAPAKTLELFTRAVGGGAESFDRITGNLEKLKSLEDVKAIEEITNLSASLLGLRREFELLQVSPDGLSDSLVRLQNELLITQESASIASESLERQLNAAVRGFFTAAREEAGRGGAAKDIDVSRFLGLITQPLEDIDPNDLEQIQNILSQVGPELQKASEEILNIIVQREQSRITLEEKSAKIREEQEKRAKALYEETTKAASTAFEAGVLFNSELNKFGQNVSKSTLETIQGIGLTDIDQVLAGTSDLDQGLQELIVSIFGSAVQKAQQDLTNVTVEYEAQLKILAAQLDEVNKNLNDVNQAEEYAANFGKKKSIELAIQNAEEKRLLDSVDKVVKLRDAERKAIEDSAEAEKQRIENLDKLRKAASEFDKELKNVNQEFDDFIQQRLSDLLSKEADAQQELKQAQEDVLSSTSQLSDSYLALIQAQLDYNGVIAEAQIKSNSLANDIAKLTGNVGMFNDQLSSITNVFEEVLNKSNITLQKRIELERQLAEETLSFLQQAKDQIVSAGIGIFGQSAQENTALGQGIAGLQLVADKLGGSFEAFLNLSQTDLQSVSQTLLALPQEFRQQILDTLSFLPSTTNVGGFSIDQLREAIGQVGAGVAPEEGLPSIEELNTRQVEQLTKLQELALQDAQLQFTQVISAQEQLAVAQEALDSAQIMQERAEQGVLEVRDAIIEESAILDQANIERMELLNAVIEADDRNTLEMIQKEAEAFAEQNSVFREVGNQIIQGISSAVNARLAVIEASAAVGNAATGYIPNFAGGNISPKEAAGLLRAASREKRAMPAGAGLAVENTSEAIIPMRNKGFIPNFQEGNFGSSISAGISAVKQINETVVAAIARSVTQSLSNIGDGVENNELLSEIVSQLRDLNDTLVEVNESNAQIQTNTNSAPSNTNAIGSSNQVRITLETNQNSVVNVTGLESLRDQISQAVRQTAIEQVDEQLTGLLTELDNILVSLQERGLISSFGQPR